MKFNNETLYTIEVNGGVIGFDLADLTNIERIEAMYDKFEKVQREFKAKHLQIEKQNNQEVNKYGMSVRERDILENINTFLKKSAKSIDLFFGEGASDKIFYEPLLDRVLITEPRLVLFMEELLPKELEKAGIKQEEYINKRTSKESKERFVKKDDEIKKVG